MAITMNYGWPLPDHEGIQQTEIAKIATALSSADGKAKEIADALAAQIAAFSTHTHSFASLTGKPTSLAGYGITDAYTKTAVDAAILAAVNDLLDGAGPAFDTLKEFQTALGNDPNFATTITTLVGQKLAKALNLSDLPDKATARANLGADAAYLGKTAQAADSAKLGGQLPTYYTDIAARLGFAPVQQGTGTDQFPNQIKIGWGAGSVLRVQVDATDFGSVWPISISGTAANSTKLAGVLPSTAATGNTIAQRTAQGYLYGSYFNANHAVSAVGSPTAFFVEAANDGFMRKTTPAAAAAALPLVGVGQTWQDVSASRARDVVYQNTTSRPIMVIIGAGDAGNRPVQVSSNNVAWVTVGNATSFQEVTFIVPVGHYYKLTGGGFTGWAELR